MNLIKKQLQTKITFVNINDERYLLKFPFTILELINYLKSGGIPIIAGFQGITKDGDITTLGRGGSDTSAVAISVALDAKECQIYTDVDAVRLMKVYKETHPKA